MHQRQKFRAKDAKIALELADTAYAVGLDLDRKLFPEGSHVRIATLQRPAKQRLAPRAVARSGEFEKFGMSKRPECTDPQVQASDLCRGQIDDHDLGRIQRQHRQRVVPRRTDRHKRLARALAQPGGQDIRVLPQLRIADVVEGRLAFDLTRQTSQRSTVPDAPLTASISPSSIHCVAPFRPTTQGIPSSRATMAE